MISDSGNTRVLLVTVQNPQSIILPHSLFYRYFSNYGEVFKILIFEKGKLWKCFVEMSSIGQAMNSLQLNGVQIFENTVMNVYLSSLQFVTFQNNNSGGIDYRQIKMRNSSRTMQHIDQPYQKIYSQPNIQYFKFESSSQSFDLERTRASSNVTHDMKKLSLEFIADDEQVFKSGSMKSINLIEEHSDNDDEIDEDIMNAFCSNGQYCVPEVEDKNTQFDPYTYISPQFLKENQPSKVVYIRGLAEITPIQLFNLLSNCGNVLVIIYIKHKMSALVQFEKLNHAQNALDHLNNQYFFGQKLKIFYSNYQEIQLPVPQQSQTQVFIPQPELHRFTEMKSIIFNPPSHILHLSNIKSALNEQQIRDLFIGIGQVQGIKFIHIGDTKHMALVKLSSVEEALNGAALLHGKEVLGRKINVSFTKSKF